MRKIQIIILALLTFNCTSGGDSKSAADNKPLENVLTLELQFGDEGLSDKFLLAEPVVCGVDDKDRIYILDELFVKVFSADGEELDIFGGSGQGPGEISRGGNLNIGPAGYIAINDTRGLSIFSPEYEYITMFKTRNNQKFNIFLEQNNYSSISVSNAIAFDSESWVSMNIIYLPRESNDKTMYLYLLYETESSYKIIGKSMRNTIVSVDGMSMQFAWRGNFSYGIANDNSLVYHISREDVNSKLENPMYSIAMIPYKSLLDEEPKKQVINHEYEQISIPDSLKRGFTEAGSSNMPDQIKKPFMQIGEKIKNDNFYTPVQELLIDGNLIFAFTYKQNESGEIMADIFDIETQSYLRSAYFSVIPDAIRNGFAYKAKRDSETLPVIQKYRINPAVYAK